MRYSKPHYFDLFTCTAEKCPDTCCAGWQIVIDEDSLEAYGQIRGAFGNRLCNAIDWEESSFLQYNGRCSMLDEENLCDLYRELGEDALCETCKRYPRHIEEFEGLREWSLSLSCPVAAKIMLECQERVRFEEWEDEEPDPLEEEFEDFDLLLFTQLEDARAVLLQIVQNREVGVEQRMETVLVMAREMQSCIDEERYCDMDGVIAKYRSMRECQGVKTGQGRAASREKEERQGAKAGQGQDAGWKNESFRENQSCREEEKRYEKMCRGYHMLQRFERLREDWDNVLKSAWEKLYQNGEQEYLEICRRFEQEWCSEHEEQWIQMTEQLLVFFLYTYFCGAVYDDWIYSKAAMAVFSVCWIRELLMARWAAAGGKLEWEDCIEISYRYAREMEHSDVNLDMLEEWLQGNGF